MVSRLMRTWMLLAGILLQLTQFSFGLPLKATLTPVNLTTEMRVDPIGVGTKTPLFGWNLSASPAGARNLRQSGYRILVASSPQQLAHGGGDIWDSGRVLSTEFWQIAYAGQPLQSHTTYYWQAQAWNGGEAPGPWSKPARFTTGLLAASDWTAHWIAAQPDRASSLPAQEGRGTLLSALPPPLPAFRRDFKLRGPVASALLFVSGLGQYEVHLNGANVTDTVLNPAWTVYRKTISYDTYDVRNLLRPGVNAFAVLLGNGMYNVEGVKGHYTKFIGSYGQPKLLLQMEVRYIDGTSERFVSDNSWLTHPGPITYSSTYGGEDFQASALPSDWDRAGFQPRGWQQALEVGSPGGALLARQSPPLVVAEIYKPVRIAHPRPDITVYDLGQNMSGWPAISVQGPAGSKVSLRPGELLASDGSVTQHSADASAENPVLFRYTLRGSDSPESWRPRFSYYGFRYVEVSVQPARPGGTLPQVLSLTGQFVHARVSIAGRFSSSDTLFNRIHGLIDRAVLSNLSSVVTDCPTREKLGWLEQTYLNASTLMLNYDVSGLYEKMSDDMADAQLANGMVPSIAPEYVAFVDDHGDNTAFRDSPEWGSAAILSPWALYQFTGDWRPLRAHYPAMQHYAAYLGSRAQGGLLDYGLGDWYDIGPGSPGESQLTSKLLTATGAYYEDLHVLAQIAALLGHSQDAAAYAHQASEVREAFNARLFHPETNEYDRGSQTANALPLALGMVPTGHERAVLENLVADIRAHGNHVTAGDVGFHYVVRALTDFGRSDVLAAMLARTDSPSYGYQLAHGATTLTEAWDADPDSSQNHFMLGHGEEWFYRGLAGLSFNLARSPDDAITLAPSLLHGVTSASASYGSPMGWVYISWHWAGNGATVSLTVPPGAQALVLLPAATGWLENGKSAARATGVLDYKEAASGVRLRLGSGNYLFSTTMLQQAASKAP
ncbi:MAG: family 78 glycoside hydrolase catalytic domain [Terracidiphilus sp.]